MMAGWTTLVQAETLSIALGRADLAIIDCRFSLANPGAGELAYQQSHLPGAVYAHLDRDLSDHRKRDQGRHPWPEAADFTARLGVWGITPQHQVIVYDDGDGALAARAWFMLRALGHEKVAVLDGGWARWTGRGLPVDSRMPAPPAARYVAQFDAGRLLDAGQVQARLAAGELLIDARAADRFRGENEHLDRIAGHVPGARNRPYADNLVDGRFKTPIQLAEEFRALLGAHAPTQTMVMCGSGVTACHHLLAMERAGFKGAKLFTGSWSGWIADPTRPVATGAA
ncbi:sulfurtransferase [Cognatiluteimonas weifangensis]|uniref:Sulfurtransferase n=1 Tax=Cognatiluteimonas weifangensis TaxID=2303539 RepID=A0A372DL80_9GAMM|nr:sulfurtransferase [Luteimonas weifangensis]RFP60335.1 sulfurtransferase [Luteimonas weifangensis]